MENNLGLLLRQVFFSNRTEGARDGLRLFCVIQHGAPVPSVGVEWSPQPVGFHQQ